MPSSQTPSPTQEAGWQFALQSLTSPAGHCPQARGTAPKVPHIHRIFWNFIRPNYCIPAESTKHDVLRWEVGALI